MKLEAFSELYSYSGRMVERGGNSGLLGAAKWNFDLPPDAARRFVEDMRAYDAEKSTHVREEIAARQAGLRRRPIPQVPWQARPSYSLDG
jgi:hypothetical protein